MMRSLRRFAHTEHGLAAVEFALILPLMLTMYFGGVELGSALTASRKAQSVASSIADLVAQGKTINDTQITDVFNTAAALMAPYDPTKITVVLTSVYYDPASQKAKVRWSRGLYASPLSKDSVVTLPAGILPDASTSVIMAKVTYFYQTTYGQFLTNGLTMSDTFYARPRRSVEVICTTCP